jgi:6-phospho-beta-glucosidase
MIAMCPIYPLTCAPDDMMMAMNAMHRRYWFTDVHVRGKYPQHLLNYFERRGFALDITEEDKAALNQGCVDYIGFQLLHVLRHQSDGGQPAAGLRREQEPGL